MKKSKLDLTILKKSFETLKECYKDYNLQEDEKLKGYIKDSCIQRFEYTYESAKKIMNKFLKKEYDKTEKDLSVNNIFREMYGLGLKKVLKTGQITEKKGILPFMNTVIK